MPQAVSNKACHPDQNVPYMRDRHDDFQLAEVEEILRDPNPSKIMSEPPILPKGGEVYLYRHNALDKRVRDEYWWVNRGNNFHSKGQKRPSIMKTYFSLKDRNGGRKSDCLNGFRRHLYRLADARDDEAIIFIHYLGDETLHKPKPHGNTKIVWYNNQSGASSRDTTTATKAPEFEFTTLATGPYQSKVMARMTTNIGNKVGSLSGSVRVPTNVFSGKPGVSSSMNDKIRQTANNQKRLISGWNNNNKIGTNKTINNPRFLHNNSGPSAKIAKVTIDLTENGQELPLSRTGQHNVQPPSQAYIQQPVSSPVLARRIKLSTPGSSAAQQPRLQRAFGLTRQPVKSVPNLHKNQNSLQLSARTHEQQQQQQQQPIKVRHLPIITKTRLPTSSQVIFHEALQEPGDYISQNDQILNRGQEMSEDTMPYSSAYIPQNNQPPTSGTSSLRNSSNNEASVSDDSALPMDYKRFFEEASKLPRMGCDVFVLVSYPGCKPAYWGTEKYVKKFENSERLLPFSASGCLSIRLNGTTDKKNLLANNLDLSQPIQRQLNEVNSSVTSPDPNIVIKEESRENDGDEDMGMAQDIVKQEQLDTVDSRLPPCNRQTRIKVTAQRPANKKTDSQPNRNNSTLKSKYGCKKQLNTTGQYEGTESYGFPPETNDCLCSRLSLENQDDTNFYDKALVYKDEPCGGAGDGSVQSPHATKEQSSTDESMLRLPPEIVEPNRVLIKVEPQTDDYGELNSLVYTEYG